MNDEKFIDNIFNISTALWGGDIDTLKRFFKEFVSSDDNENSIIIDENNAKRKQLGHYSAAMFYYGNEWYWGIDRLYHLETRLKELALDVSENKEVYVARKKEVTFPKLKTNNKFDNKIDIIKIYETLILELKQIIITYYDELEIMHIIFSGCIIDNKFYLDLPKEKNKINEKR